MLKLLLSVMFLALMFMVLGEAISFGIEKVCLEAGYNNTLPSCQDVRYPKEK